jgi:cobalt-zinc-cadmium efflux system protein
MGHGHAHGHASGRAQDRSRLRVVLVVTALVCAVELVGAWASHSLALLADAGHLAMDAAGLVLALSASMVAALAPSGRRTYGWHRAEILAALVNALVLLGVCGYLAYAGIHRLVRPGAVDAPQMLVYATVGLAANALALGLLTGRRDSSLNMRGAWLEVLGDALGSLLAILAAVAIWLTGYVRADPIASLVIAALILPRSLGLLRETTGVLLESAPKGLDLADLRRHLCGGEGVVDVHDVHAWTITSGMPAFSAHVTVTDDALARRGVGAVLDDLSACVREHFGIDHATFQVEPQSHRAHEDLGETEHA